jgi:hypothetical protein
VLIVFLRFEGVPPAERAYAESVLRILVGVIGLLALAGCGGGNSHPGRNTTRSSNSNVGTGGIVGAGRTTSEAPIPVRVVKTAFRHHGIRLSHMESAVETDPYYALFVGRISTVEVFVYIYRKVHRGYYTFLVGPGTPRTAGTRNVIATWAGPNLRRVRAAINELK